MNIPTIGLRNTVVIEGTAAGDLIAGPGHLRNTPLPGQIGTTEIYGRASLFGGPFGDIASLHKGDEITFAAGQGDAISYLVEGVRRAGDPYPPLLADGGGRLVLVSGEGGGWRSGWAPSRTVYVDALLQGKGMPTPTGRPQRVPTAELALQPDVGALYQLVLWLALLMVVALAGLWAQDRWGRAQTWLIGVPAFLAALWGASETAAQLLPNLM
jgi:sortase A